MGLRAVCGVREGLSPPVMLGKTKCRRKRGNRRWDGWMASLIQWTWVWANSGRWRRTGRPGMLQPMGSQIVGHDWVTEQQKPPPAPQCEALLLPHPSTCLSASICTVSSAGLYKSGSLFTDTSLLQATSLSPVVTAKSSLHLVCHQHTPTTFHSATRPPSCSQLLPLSPLLVPPRFSDLMHLGALGASLSALCWQLRLTSLLRNCWVLMTQVSVSAWVSSLNPQPLELLPLSGATARPQGNILPAWQTSRTNGAPGLPPPPLLLLLTYLGR